jgi:MerR family redox-sensitive transcriptional activator SoxR
MDETLTIGQLAQRFGLNTSAIRYYEANGVLPEPVRVSGQRRYGPDAVRRLEVLDVAKRAGFSLDEARVLLQSAQAGTPAFESLRDLAARKLPDVDALIARAQAMRAWLLTANDCSCTSLDICALFKRGSGQPASVGIADPLRVTHVGGVATASPSACAHPQTHAGVSPAPRAPKTPPAVLK